MNKRQLEAIMFTDIVGYSALTQRNEALALSLLEQHWQLLRSVFTKFDGNEIKTIGDAFLIEFPSALRAVEAGLAMQRTLADYNRGCDDEHKIQIRIGIHLGDVERRENDVFGDGVNIASRIEPLASPGGLCISEPVYTSVRNIIDVPFHSMGEQKLKNISQPVVVYSNSTDQQATLNNTSFWQELRRRNVFKVGAAYAIVAWLLIQLTATAAPALQLPGWVPSLITYLLVIGLPLILLFAWAFELTPEGVKPTRQVKPTESITRTTSRKFDFYIIGLMAAAIIFLVLDNYIWIKAAAPPALTTATEVKPGTTTAAPLVSDNKSIAVLPFANRSKSEDDAFFVDGIHDDILTQLSKISDMKVISRTSVMRYRDTEKSMKTIGKELGVATLLEGGVQRAGKQIRVNVQLINANTDEHLWAETYDRGLTASNIFAIQSEIARAIARALLTTLSPEEQTRIAAVPTENLAAYEAYLLGKQRMAKRTSKALAEALDNFQQAITLDPSYALAYVGLADVYQLQIGYSGLPPDETNALAESAINKALALDDKSGEAYASLGLLKWQKREYAGAEVAFKQALALNPSYATAYQWYAALLADSGRDKEASAQMQKALALDPLSIIINFNVANYHTRFGRFDEAMAQNEKIIEIDPTAPLGYSGKAYLFWSVYGRLDKAAAWLGKAVSLDPGNPQHSALLGALYAGLGDDQQAGCWLKHAIKLGPDDSVANSNIAYLYTSRGQDEQALPYARLGLKYTSDQFDSLAVLRDIELRAGHVDQARAHYEKVYPALLSAAEPAINRLNYQAAIDLAYVLRQSGEQKRANLLLDRSLAFIQSGMPRLGYGGYGIADVQIYAQQGDNKRALATLRQAIDESWRGNWSYYLEQEPSLASLRSEPEFQAMITEIKADMATQLARVRAAEKPAEVCVE